MSTTKKTQKRLADARRAPQTNLILTVGLVVVAALILGGVLWTNRQSTADNAPAAQVDLTSMTAAGSHALTSGGDGAPELVEFIDFQCEACNAYYHNITRRLVDDYQGRINFTVRLFPLPGHPLGATAAQSAQAAAMQGKFYEFYSVLFDEYDTWAGHTESGSADLEPGRAYFLDVAQRIGLDVEKFSADRDSAEVVAVVQESVAAGQQLGVSGTPTFFLDGAKFGDSANSFAEFDQQLRAALDAGIG